MTENFIFNTKMARARKPYGVFGMSKLANFSDDQLFEEIIRRRNGDDNGSSVLLRTFCCMVGKWGFFRRVCADRLKRK